MLNNTDRFFLFDEIFPFLKSYIGKLFVVKYGGSIMQNELLQSQFIDDLSFLHFLGIKVVLVHGGGPSINNWLVKFNIKPKFENGFRVTDASTMEIVEMVLSGKINKHLVSLFNRNNVLSVGLSGKDANLVESSPLFCNSTNLVGCVDSVNNNILQLLLDNCYLPVVSSISNGLDNRTYNINADTFAGSLAESLSAEKLVLLTDTLGVMRDINVSSSLIKSLKISDVQILKDKAIISGGMIPKVDCCVKALQGGVKSVHIIDGRISHSLLHELFTPEGIGSKITL
uniref:Acetylglutamate kinase n=1 Tax=Caloglossa intermedia TaxID=100879 RepID=A0A1Z1M6G7_9FLOR|nr:acetylglutamate kinase [Caloglossa intermedia]ARW61530.1 acetylglutamate kinase [Caloglossa intermedia]